MSNAFKNRQTDESTPLKADRQVNNTCENLQNLPKILHAKNFQGFRDPKCKFFVYKF